MTDTSHESREVRVEEFFGNVFFHPSPKGLWYQPWWIYKRGKQLVSNFQHAVITVHDYPPFYNGIGALLLSRATKVPYILEVHHIVGYPVAASFTEWVGRWMTWFYLPTASRMATSVRTVSKATTEVLIGWGVPQPQLRVVPSFYLDRELIASLGERPPVKYDAVFCGRLVANKGAAELIRAMAAVPRTTLLIIGDGPERIHLEELAKSLDIAPRIEFRGWLPTQRDVLQAIRSAKFLVMNSTSEGGPRVPLEAMACGVPVIVTRVGVMPDVVIDGMNGLFTTGSSADLAEKITYMLHHEEQRQRMEHEAVAILDRFERGRLIAQYARYLQGFAKH